VDLTTDDDRAWALAPHLVLVGASAGSMEWMNPETGTTCKLDSHGDYVVLRKVGDRILPVVAGQILRDAAASLFEEPESVRARRAAAHAIVAVDEGVRGQGPPRSSRKNTSQPRIASDTA
jgi:hypothetical protein